MGYLAVPHSPSLATESGVEAHRRAVRTQNPTFGPAGRPRPRERREAPMTKRRARTCREALPSAYAYPACSATARQECRRDNTARRRTRTCDSTLPATPTPNFFHVHTPASTLRTRVSVKNVPWGSDRARGGRRARAHVLPSPAAGKGLTPFFQYIYSCKRRENATRRIPEYRLLAYRLMAHTVRTQAFSMPFKSHLTSLSTVGLSVSVSPVRWGWQSEWECAI
jgi:hypothetical protein